MISFLTAIVLMVAIGTALQRADIFSGEGGGDDKLVLVDDRFEIAANTLQKLDIFANDTGLDDPLKESLAILSEPECGRVLARRGVLQYYGGDECAGPQRIVYTLEAMDEPGVATVTAFVISDRRPDIRPDPDGRIADRESPLAGDSRTSAAARPSDGSARQDDDSAGGAPDRVSVLAGGAAPAHAGTRPPTDDAPTDDAPTDDAPGDWTARDLPARDLPARDMPAGDGIVTGRAPAGRVAPAPPDRPDGAGARERRDGGSLALAIIRPDADIRGPASTDSATLAPPDTVPDAGLVPPDGGDDSPVGRRRPVELKSNDAGDRPGDLPDTLAADGVAVPASRRLADLSAGAGAGDASAMRADPADRAGRGGDVIADRRVAALDRNVPLPGRAAGGRAGGIGDPADRPATGGGRIAALTPGGTAAGSAGEEAPLGTDLTPEPLLAGTPGDARSPAWADGASAPLPRVLASPHLAGPDPRAGDRPDPDRVGGTRVPGAGLPPVVPGPSGRMAPASPPNRDEDRTLGRGAAEDGVPRTRAGHRAPDQRLAALSDQQKRTPRTALMNVSPEPDPVGAGRVPDAPAPASLRDDAVPAHAGTAAGPDAWRLAAILRNDAASSYSFFTTLPRRRIDAADRRVRGAARPAGGWAPELGDAAPAGAATADGRIAAPADGTLPAPAAPGAALARMPVAPGSVGGPGTANDVDGDRMAARPGATDACVVPPSAELEIRRAAQTVVRISAPCQADTIAELAYSGLRLAIRLDRQGRGSVLALGFEPSASALVRFADRTVLDFDIPFPDIERIDRVAVVWEQPVTLDLHALEFGARTGDEDHVFRDKPRTFQQVRRRGGGFLNVYSADTGVGQNAQIYTHWRRNGARTGVVRLMIDYASRNRDRLEGTCGTGTYAAPGFIVLRSSAGRLERPVIRRLAAINCSSVLQETGDKRLISGAIDDLVIKN